MRKKTVNGTNSNQWGAKTTNGGEQGQMGDEGALEEQIAFFFFSLVPRNERTERHVDGDEQTGEVCA